MDEEFNPEAVAAVRSILNKTTPSRLEGLLQAVYRHYFAEYQTRKLAEPASNLSDLRKEFANYPTIIPTQAIEIARRQAEIDANSKHTFRIKAYCPYCGSKEYVDHLPSARSTTKDCEACHRLYRVILARVSGMEWGEQDDDYLVQTSLIDSAGMSIRRKWKTPVQVEKIKTHLIDGRIVALIDVEKTLARIEVEPLIENDQQSPYYHDIIFVKPDEILKKFEEPDEPTGCRVRGANVMITIGIVGVIVFALYVVISTSAKNAANTTTSENVFMQPVVIPTGQHRSVLRDVDAMLKSVKPERPYKLMPASTEVTIMGLNEDGQWVQLSIDSQSAWIPIDALDQASLPTNLTRRYFTDGFSGTKYDNDGNNTVDCKDFTTAEAAVRAYRDGHRTLDTNRDGAACGRGDAR